MYHYHTTKEGERMLICEMSNEHLQRTIMMFLNKLSEVVDAAKANSEIDEFNRVLLDRPNITMEKAANATKDMANILAPYVMEATLRGIEKGVVPRMREVFGREKAVPKVSRKPLLVERVDIIDISIDDPEF